MNKIKNYIILTLVTLGLMAGLVAPVAVHAQSAIPESVRDKLKTSSEKAAESRKEPGGGFKTTTGGASDAGSQACSGVTDAFGGTCDPSDPDAAKKQVGGIFGTIVDVLSFIIGGICVVMIIIGGFRYIISGGDQAGVSSAKNTILYAIVGLVVVIFAQVIVKFVIGSFGK